MRGTPPRIPRPRFKLGIDDGKLMIGIKPETVLQMIALRDLGKYLLLAVEKHEELNGREITSPVTP